MSTVDKTRREDLDQQRRVGCSPYMYRGGTLILTQSLTLLSRKWKQRKVVRNLCTMLCSRTRRSFMKRLMSK